MFLFITTYLLNYLGEILNSTIAGCMLPHAAHFLTALVILNRSNLTAFHQKRPLIFVCLGPLQ